MEQLPQRSFPRPQGAISSLQKDLYVVQRAASNEDLLKLIRAGNYVLLHGNRMCGKSTRVLQIIEHNTGEFRGLWVTMQELWVGWKEAPRDHDVHAFWRSTQDALHHRYRDLFPNVSAEGDTAAYCRAELTKVFLAELDLLAAANPAVRDSFMGFLRAIRQSTGACAKRAVLAVVGISSYEALELDAVAGGAGNADPARGGVPVPSPWGDRVKEQHFLLPELKAVAQEYTADYGVTLPDFFIEDLFGSTHGHPGLTMMALRDYHEHAVLQCGRSNGGDLPSWDSFCRTRFWETMLSNVALQTAVGAVTSSHLCRSIIERKGLLLRNRFDLDSPEFSREDAPALRWMTVHGLIRRHNEQYAVWTCPLFRMHVLRVLSAGLIAVPPVIPVMHLGGGGGDKRILVVELLKLLIPRISTPLVARALARTTTTGAPLEYVYQSELLALLSWAFTRNVGGDNPRVIPEANESGGGRRRVGLVLAHNRGVCAIELGADMDQRKHNECYERTCSYVTCLRRAYPDKHVSAVVINFTTDTCSERCACFPSNPRDDISLLNVRVWLDDPDQTVFYVCEPASVVAEANLCARHTFPAGDLGLVVLPESGSSDCP